MQEAKALLRLAQEAGVIVQIGHVERFNPVFTTALPHIKTPKMIVCQRLSPVNDRGMDVSVVMDLMIHDIDLVLHLTKASPRKILAYGIPWRGKGTLVCLTHTFYFCSFHAIVDARSDD